MYKWNATGSCWQYYSHSQEKKLSMLHLSPLLRTSGYQESLGMSQLSPCANSPLCLMSDI